MVIKKFPWFIIILVLVACNNEDETIEQQELREKLIEVNQLGVMGELNKADIDVAISEASQLDLQGVDRKWFILFHLLYTTNGIEADTEKVYEDSQLRILYEQTWQELALERYGVQLEEEKLQEILETSLRPLKESVLTSEEEQEDGVHHYFAEALGYSLDEYFYMYTIHVYERRAISETLYPLLEREYNLADEHDVSLQYRMEVIEEIVETIV
ncbi:hypothetical protein [Halalkalibacter krulwichiae]|uniref:Uncharacterized protein n=1 Tax=Halalkalibacter krulwichiae TaxID=199441 RepID=A0A1X9M912_9BACI|nr:hypothetical protein [Halalkalibacter krulwichiae]ARK29949.1 hypothetical protein BkAM31D_08770 [Halalkalibacter krulwichiae]